MAVTPQQARRQVNELYAAKVDAEREARQEYNDRTSLLIRPFLYLAYKGTINPRARTWRAVFGDSLETGLRARKTWKKVHQQYEDQAIKLVNKLVKDVASTRVKRAHPSKTDTPADLDRAHELELEEIRQAERNLLGITQAGVLRLGALSWGDRSSRLIHRGVGFKAWTSLGLAGAAVGVGILSGFSIPLIVGIAAAVSAAPFALFRHHGLIREDRLALDAATPDGRIIGHSLGAAKQAARAHAAGDRRTTTSRYSHVESQRRAMRDYSREIEELANQIGAINLNQQANLVFNPTGAPLNLDFNPSPQANARINQIAQQLFQIQQECQREVPVPPTRVPARLNLARFFTYVQGRCAQDIHSKELQAIHGALEEVYGMVQLESERKMQSAIEFTLVNASPSTATLRAMLTSRRDALMEAQKVKNANQILNKVNLARERVARSNLDENALYNEVFGVLVALGNEDYHKPFKVYLREAARAGILQPIGINDEAGFNAALAPAAVARLRAQLTAEFANPNSPVRKLIVDYIDKKNLPENAPAVFGARAAQDVLKQQKKNRESAWAYFADEFTRELEKATAFSSRQYGRIEVEAVNPDIRDLPDAMRVFQNIQSGIEEAGKQLAAVKAWETKV